MKKITFLAVTLLMLCGASVVRASDICKDSTECASGYLCLLNTLGVGHCTKVEVTVKQTAIPTTVPTVAPTAKPSGCINNSTCKYGASDCVALGYTKGTGTCSGGVCCGAAPTPTVSGCTGGSVCRYGVSDCVALGYTKGTGTCAGGTCCGGGTLPTAAKSVTVTQELTTGGTSTIEGCVVGSDGDGDGEITLKDFAVWKYEYMSGVLDRGDYNCDGKLSVTDFAVWKREFLAARNLTVTENE